MIRERIREITDFVKSESPYRSANKGWLTDDIYLQRGPNKNDSSKQFDQLLEVSFFWKPIIQIAITIFIVIAMATAFAFMPLAFLNGRFDGITSSFEFRQIQIPIESTKLKVEENKKPEENIIDKADAEMIKDNKISNLIIKQNPKENNSGLILRF